MMNAVVFLARSGTDGEAIRYYSQLTGCSQAEARQVVENIKAGILPPGYDPLSSQGDSINLTTQQVEQIQNLIHSGRKTEAINFYREIADCSRTSAERAVNKMESGF
jgi:ribosomal protein L7/L12